MLSGTTPFGDGNRTEKEIFRAIQHDELHFGEGWASITSAAKELIAGLLEKDPSKRYTTDQALAHEWVSGDAASDKPIDRSVVDSLLQYNARNHFKRAAVRLVASHLTAKDVHELRALFMKMDADDSGTITRQEMVNAMRAMGVADKDPEVFRRVVDAVDADGDGKVSWEEFLEASLEPQMVRHQQQVWQAFCAMDKDGSGQISVDELREVLKDEPIEKIEKYIAEYDLNKDGFIDYEEFLRMLLPKNLKVRVAGGDTRSRWWGVRVRARQPTPTSRSPPRAVQGAQDLRRLAQPPPTVVRPAPFDFEPHSPHFCCRRALQFGHRARGGRAEQRAKPPPGSVCGGQRGQQRREGHGASRAWRRRCRQPLIVRPPPPPPTLRRRGSRRARGAAAQSRARRRRRTAPR